jgi:hypothetical protein
MIVRFRGLAWRASKMVASQREVAVMARRHVRPPMIAAVIDYSRSS